MAFAQERPSGLVYGPPLEGTRLSRRQLLLEPAEDGSTLAATSVGGARCSSTARWSGAASRAPATP